MIATRPDAPLIEQHRVVRCTAAACRSTEVQVASSRIRAGFRLNVLRCRTCGHTWKLTGSTGRLLVVAGDGRQRPA